MLKNILISLGIVFFMISGIFLVFELFYQYSGVRVLVSILFFVWIIAVLTRYVYMILFSNNDLG